MSISSPLVHPREDAGGFLVEDPNRHFAHALVCTARFVLQKVEVLAPPYINPGNRTLVTGSWLAVYSPECRWRLRRPPTVRRRSPSHRHRARWPPPGGSRPVIGAGWARRGAPGS